MTLKLHVPWGLAAARALLRRRSGNGLCGEFGGGESFGSRWSCVGRDGQPEEPPPSTPPLLLPDRKYRFEERRGRCSGTFGTRFFGRRRVKPPNELRRLVFNGKGGDTTDKAGHPPPTTTTTTPGCKTSGKEVRWEPVRLDPVHLKRTEAKTQHSS